MPERFNPPTMPPALVTTNRNEYRTWAQNEIERGADVTFDFTDCVYVDSAGCGMLVSLRNYARNRGRVFAVANVTGDVASLFHLTRLDTLFPVSEAA